MKSLSSLISGITSNHNGDFYCLNCFHSYSTKNKLKKHERVCNDHDCCYVEMPNEDNKILKYNHEEKSMKAPFILNLTWSVYLKEYTHVKIILKNITQKKNICIFHLVAYCLHIAHLTQQKTNLIVIEAKIVWKRVVTI